MWLPHFFVALRNPTISLLIDTHFQKNEQNFISTLALNHACIHFHLLLLNFHRLLVRLFLKHTIALCLVLSHFYFIFRTTRSQLSTWHRWWRSSSIPNSVFALHTCRANKKVLLQRYIFCWRQFFMFAMYCSKLFECCTGK